MDSHRRLPSGIRRRGHSYQIDVTLDGVRHRRQVATLPEARRLVQQLRTEANQAADSGGPLLSELIGRYLERSHLHCRPASVETAAVSCRRLSEYVGDREASGLTASDVEDFAAWRLGRVSREAVNRDLRYLRAVLRLAVEEGSLARMPCKVKQLRTPKRLPSWLEPHEITQLLDAADDHVRPLLHVAVLTGFRMSELRHLQWADWTGEGLHVRAKRELDFVPKGCAERVFPVQGALRRVLMEQRLAQGGPQAQAFMFTGRRGARWSQSGLVKAARRAFQRAGLYRRGKSMHELRRTAARTLMVRGIHARVIQVLMGWSTVRLLEAYAGVSSTDMVAAAHSLEAAIRE